MSELGAIALKATNLNHLKQLHAHIIQNSLHHENYWVASLITLCTRLKAPPSYARLIFDSAYQPNVFVFTNMLKFYSHLGSHDDVTTLFRRMRNSGVKPDAFIFPVVIKSAGEGAVSILHGHVLKFGHGSDHYVCNAIVNAYVRYCPMAVARKLFDEMSGPMVADCNTMISGYWRCGNEVEACRLFCMMPERNVISWTTMVTGFSSSKDLANARIYFNRMPEKNVISWSAMLSGYAQNGFAEDAIELFNEMISAGVQPNEAAWVAVISSCSSCGDPRIANSLVEMLSMKGVHLNYFVKTSLLDMYAKCGNLAAARDIFEELGGNRNSVTWNAMISAYMRVGDLTSARELFDRMLEKDVITWNSMISGYAQNGQSVAAIDLFKEMTRFEDTKPDAVTAVSVISACGHLGALQLGNWVLNFLKTRHINLSISGYNALIFMYSKCGSMKDAEKIFLEMQTRDTISYNTLISGFAAHGHGPAAVDLMSKMKEEGIKPDRITYIGVLTACSHAGLLDEGKKVFESISTPDTDHFACMVDLLGRVGKLDEAKSLVEKMPMEPHAGVYGSLLNASQIHRRVDLGEFAAKKLFELEPENSGNYILLSNIYASTGRWRDVERVRQELRKWGVRKSTGWSWVEHGGGMHKFIVGDQSHERLDEIYKKLGELREKMRVSGYTADTGCVLKDVEEEEKEEMLGTHSEKLAIAFSLLVSEAGAVIRVVKNLRVCRDCHTAIKIISKLEEREIIVRDNNRFHCFSNGLCSCNDYW